MTEIAEQDVELLPARTTLQGLDLEGLGLTAPGLVAAPAAPPAPAAPAGLTPLSVDDPVGVGVVPSPAELAPLTV